MPDPAWLKSAGAHWLRELPWPCGSKSGAVGGLRGEPRRCGDRAHRLVAPSLAPTGERRPSMACLRPIPAPPRLSPSGCPWLRRCWSKARWRQCLLQRAELLARRSGERHTAKDVAARGFRPSGTWMYRARVLEQDAQPRGGRNPLAAAAPARSEAFALAAAAPARNALQQPKRFSTAGWLVMAAHPGLRRAVRQLQSPSAAATNGGATSTPVCRWAV